MSFEEYKEFIKDSKKISDIFEKMSEEKKLVALAYISGLNDGGNLGNISQLQKIG